MIKLENVSKVFKVKESRKQFVKIALNDISFVINDGETVGLVGANGSGKSTLLKVLSTLYQPSVGKVYIDGKDIFLNSDESKKKLGVLFGGDSGLYPNLTAYENIEYFGKLNGLSEQEIRHNIAHYSQFFSMEDYINRRVANFSRGMKQKVCFLRSIVHNPQIVILDEPSTGLDVAGIEEVAQFIKYHQDLKKTIIISSHNINEISRLCQKIIILKAGNLMYFGDLQPLISDKSFNEVYKLMGVSDENL
ncbi:MAG: ABC transporter ATP-binding protein [Acholeplasmatales bacterium]|jgi:sodium transport system ATP-binding protein|nr:ABC transporter ATP-binding protein [Acholeplasmatales bacterium]